MASFTREIRIGAPVETVWAALADIDTIHRWNPGVSGSHLTSEHTDGLGASRHCDLGSRNYLREAVAAWEPQRRLTMRITETNLPFESADIRFALRADGIGTAVTVSPEYRLKYGAVGRALDRLLIRRRYEAGMQALLEGLKRYVEGGTASAV
ncbi:MAG: SRPBCC family protein [Rhodothermales bacterium]